MKKLIASALFIISLFALQAQPVAQNTNPTKKVGSAADILPTETQQASQQLVNVLLNRYHYRKVPLNDSTSSVIFDRYLEALDPNRMYFLNADIKNFEKYRFQLDEALQTSDLVPAYFIFNIYKRRFLERSNFIPKILEKEFDYNTDEYYEANREKVAFAQDTEELNDIWRKYLKNQALSLKLANKPWVESTKILNDRFSYLTKNIMQFTAEEVFQVYMNAYVGIFDPHTDYFSPQAADDFKQDVTLSFEGIGASLTNENDYVKVADVIAGGPAFKSKLLQKGDRIVGVAQGDTGKTVDIVGWRTSDAVKLIKGKKGTVVRLTLLPASGGENAVATEIRLVRDKIKLEEQSAKKSVLQVNHKGKNYKLGVITVPSFYNDYEGAKRGDKDYKSTTRDVRKLIAELESEKIDGLVIDLRFDGGGSLQEAVELSGLFIPRGSVVQVRDTQNEIDILEDPDPNEVYNGPLAVLTNRFSASASEIFAGAIQDYKRGVIVGETTYGKGTVQNLLDLNRFAQARKEPMGQLKVTLAKFYRISGSSTQHKGVVPDVEFPSAFSAAEFGESSQPSALPWDQIPPASFKTTKQITPGLVSQLEKNHKQRLQSDGE
ncbi:MAG: carboxy terminal-processing peptidase, partial [Verrucomicrobia bacterium]|nr:carboxy terminal-processing peptidase [Cytophagales bacterium]